MNNVKLLIAGSAFFAMSAQAADRVSIDVKVTLEAAACTPILSNGGVDLPLYFQTSVIT